MRVSNAFFVLTQLLVVALKGEELEPARAKAEAAGVKEIFIDDVREEFVREYVFPMFRCTAHIASALALSCKHCSVADRKLCVIVCSLVPNRTDSSSLWVCQLSRYFYRSVYTIGMALVKDKFSLALSSIEQYVKHGMDFHMGFFDTTIQLVSLNGGIIQSPVRPPVGAARHSLQHLLCILCAYFIGGAARHSFQHTCPRTLRLFL